MAFPPGSPLPEALGARTPVDAKKTKSQVYFLDPNGMQIGWLTRSVPGGDRVYLPAQLTVPARYNFNQGYVYRLKLTNFPGRPGAALYPTVEVAPATPRTAAFLTHNVIPVQLTAEDLDEVLDGGTLVTKAIYLPDPKYQELAISGVETLVSTRLDPEIDPILEAEKRGTILLVLHLGAIDPEMHGGGSVRDGAATVPAGHAPHLLPQAPAVSVPIPPARGQAPGAPFPGDGKPSSSGR